LVRDALVFDPPLQGESLLRGHFGDIDHASEAR
jgi:hypothetical protein